MTVYTRPVPVHAFIITAVNPSTIPNEKTITLVGNFPDTMPGVIGDYIVHINGMLTLEPAATFTNKFYAPSAQPGVVGQNTTATVGEVDFTVTPLEKVEHGIHDIEEKIEDFLHLNSPATTGSLDTVAGSETVQ